MKNISIFVLLTASLVTSVCTLVLIGSLKKKELPVVAIANYGPHSSLDENIQGFKEEMAANGFIENKTILYKVSDVGFNIGLIPQMISSLVSARPQVVLAVSTPIAQFTKAVVKDIPIVFSAVTDPVNSGLLESMNASENNISGSSEKQNLDCFIEFACQLLPTAKCVGLFYATCENNDHALVEMMKNSAGQKGISVLAIPIDNSSDIQQRAIVFKDKADLIYVGSSGTIQPSLPIIASEAEKMNIPVFNFQSSAVKEGLALGCCGVDYKTVGKNAAKIVVELLRGKHISQVKPMEPTVLDHSKIINKKLAERYNVYIPKDAEVV